MYQQESTGSTTTRVAHQDLTRDDTPSPSPLTRSNFEAYSDYYGLPTCPISVYHTGDRWEMPTGPQAQRVPKEARPICEHPIADVWRELGQQLYEYLDSVKIKWTTIDPVRLSEHSFGYDEHDAGPLFLWVGVQPGSLSRENAEVAAMGCKKILQAFEIIDVEIGFRESLFTRSAGPQLLEYVHCVDAAVPAKRAPLTPALGLHIAPRSAPHFEGTGGIYICEGGESKKVFVLTARHVVLPPSMERNKLYAGKKRGQPHRAVLLLGSKAYQEVLESIASEITRQGFMADYYKDELKSLGKASKDDEGMAKQRKKVKDLLEEAEKAPDALDKFHDEVTKFWSAESQRILGHIAYSPPISVGTGTKCFTEDWALIELHEEKIDWDAFKGNVIPLGTKPESVINWIWKMYPHPKARASAKYPHGGLFLQGIVKENELHHPKMLDANGEKCLIVVKNGNSTGLTMGRASGLMSFVREYSEDGAHKTSMELAIYSYGYKDGAFSAPGDSGSVIADHNGHIVGLLTGGAASGRTGCTDFDVTYASPFYWVFERIKAIFPNAYLYTR